jgi:glycosyl transferase family 25
MSMRVHVINLAQSADRRIAIEQRLGALGVDYALCVAVEGRTGYSAFDACDFDQYRLNTGRAPSEGEVGCYASHLLLWQACAAAGEPFVVMEDDAEPLPNFAAAVTAARGLIERYGFVRFEYDGPTRPARTRKVAAAGSFTLHYFVKYPYGAMCYALSPAVARALIAASRQLRAPVDQFIKRCWEHGQPLYGLLPYSVREGPHAARSTIRARNKEPLPAAIRAKRLLHKVGTSVQRAAFNQRWTARRVAPGPSACCVRGTLLEAESPTDGAPGLRRPHEEQRDEEHRDERGCEHAADDTGADRVAAACAGACRQRQRQHAQDER